jgi:death-on-curing protein
MKKYLTLEDVLALHKLLIEHYGGAEGIRDLGAVQAAVSKPQCGYYADIVEEAAALLESLLINHPFVDGNKRTAFAACDVFLRLNGVTLTADSGWLYKRIMDWISGAEPSFAHICADLRSISMC